MTRSGFAAVIGAPNAGKSTLVNRLVGSKVSIVTHKVQTTRFPIRGVMMHGATQIVLVDTPGIFEPRRRLDRAMVRSAWMGADDADAIVHLVDARAWTPGRDGKDRAPEDDVRIIARLRELAAGRAPTAVLAVNKVDLVEKSLLLAVVERIVREAVHADVFLISGLTGDGVDALADHLAARMPEGPYLFPPDQAADMPSRLLASEITREKLMLRLHQELPYQLTVETESWTPHDDGSVRIDQMIYVAREGHKRMVLGKGGQAIRDVGVAARKEMTEAFGRPVHLFTRVKVSERWLDSRERFTAMGLDFDV
ncbi:GTPase Era [bacterium]|nr:GTPase Era [bacterium]